MSSNQFMTGVLKHFFAYAAKLHRFTLSVFLPTLIVVVGYSAAFYLLSLTLRTMPTGIAYAITGAIADPTTDPRPVVNRVTCAPHAMSSPISALSTMLGNPNLGSPGGTTSSR